MLQTILSSRHTFICIDALDECVPEYRVKLLYSLRDIIQKSRGTRVFLTGRSYIGGEIEKPLGERTSSLFISPNEDDIIKYLRSRLEEDTTPEAMDDSLKTDILKSIPESVSEMYVEVAGGNLAKSSAGFPEDRRNPTRNNHPSQAKEAKCNCGYFGAR